MGICYSKQYSKWNEAVTIFKELLNSDFKYPAMYIFLAKRSKSNLEGSKFIKEGIKNFEDNKSLKKILLFYLEDDEKEAYFLELKNDIDITFDIAIEMISIYYSKRDYKKALELFDYLNEEESPNKIDLYFLKIAISYLANKKIDVEVINSFIVKDNNSFLGFIIRLIEIDIENNENISKKLISQLNYMSEPDNPFIEIVNFENGNHSYFSIDELFYSILKKLEEKFTDVDIIRKLKLIYAFQELYLADEEKDVSKTRLKEIQKLVDEELEKHSDKILYLQLLDIYIKLSNNKKYFDTYIKAIENSHNIDYIDLSDFNLSDLDYANNYVMQNVKIYDFNSNKYQSLIETLVKTLHSHEKYSDIVKLMDAIEYEKLDYLKFGFEIAYSFSNDKRTDKTKEIYESYIIKYPNSDAAINNLGVIYEKERNYEKALEYYKKSENISHSDISSNNIKRCEELMEQSKKEIDLEQKSLEYFKVENIWIIDRIKNFYEDADEKGNVICPYKRLPIILKCSEEKSQDVLKQMLEKGYLFKNKNHDYDTNSSVYKINFSIAKRLDEIKEDNQLISSFTSNLDRFTIDELSNIEYKRVISKLNVIGKNNLKEIFIRDYNELVFNYLTNQQKTVVLMSGTLVELILLFILNKKKITTYNVGSKQKKRKIVDMDITEMLEVCDKENLIQKAPQKFMDGIKNFRNFIHPGKELREKTLELDKTTIELSFNIVNWLILNINLK
ncbi:MAG: tetratricopeptide repeat protein [Bacilli bacterium]|nr:tetratricopeptide repeat protein [Bacilli bacterium]